jgi:hypothetical protein
MGPYFKGCARSGARRPLCECGLFGDSGERQTPPVAVGCCGGPPPAPSPHVTRATSAPAAHMPRIHTHVGRVSWGRGGRGCAHACARPQRLGATPRPLTRPVGCCGGPPPAPSPHVTRATPAPAAHMPRIHTHVGRVSWGRGGRGCTHACARPQRLGATPRPLTRPVGCRGGKLLGTTGGVLLAGTAWFIFQCIGAHNNWHHLCLLDVSVCT